MIAVNVRDACTQLDRQLPAALPVGPPQGHGNGRGIAHTARPPHNWKRNRRGQQHCFMS